MENLEEMVRKLNKETKEFREKTRRELLNLELQVSDARSKAAEAEIMALRRRI